MQAERKLQFKSDNRGSVLILVIVCMFMVSLIGAMVLSATMINYRMKITQQQAAENFYDTEGVMEEVTEHVRQMMMEAYRASYEKLLMNYLDENVSQDRQEYFMLQLASSLELSYAQSSEGVYTASCSDKFTDLEARINAQLGAKGSLSFADSDAVVIEVKKQQLRIKDVALEYTDASGFRTVLKTDLVFTVSMPEDSFSAGIVQTSRQLDDYVIITDSDINSDSSGTGGAGGTVAYVDGSIYAGNSLTVNAGLQVNGNRIILGDELLLESGSHLYAYMGSSNQNGIWARNIVLDGGALELYGDCYVADDTTFTEKYSSLTIRNGGYYGYSYSGEVEGNPAKSSAILINKPEVTLDLSAANMLWLAGNAYINETKLFDEEDDGTLVPSTDGIIEGESLSYKNLQTAYLLPGCCLKGVDHNPLMMSETFSKKQGEVLTAAYMISEAGKVTQTDMTAVADIVAAADMTVDGVLYHEGSVIPAGTLIPAGTVLPIGTILPAKTKLPCDVSTPLVEMLLNKKADGSDFVEDEYFIDISASTTEVGIKLSDYVYLADPVTVRYSNTKQMVYFYLRFLSPEKASAYFMEFSNTTTGNWLLNQLKTLGNASVLLPAPEQVVTTGNLIEYDYDLLNEQSDYSLTEAGNAENLLWREALLTSNYNALLEKLTPSGRLDTNAEPLPVGSVSVFADLINPEVLFEEGADDLDGALGQKLVIQTYYDENGQEIQFCAAAGRDITTTEIRDRLSGGALDNAIIITDGNVTVDCAFGGLIIAQGTVTLKISGDERLSGGKTGFAGLVAHDVIGPYFKDYKKVNKPAAGEDDYLKMTEMLKLEFEGWVKN